jgi:hypothetical protein
MKKYLPVLVISALALSFAAIDARADWPNADMTLSATVIAPLAVDKTANLRFGSFVAPPSGQLAGTVVIDPDGTRSNTSAELYLSTADSGGPASFTLTGAPNATFAVAYNNLTSATLYNNVDNTATMLFDTITTSASRVLGSDGTNVVTIGGTLHVAAAQLAGSYSGSMIVYFQYD